MYFYDVKYNDLFGQVIHLQASPRDINDQTIWPYTDLFLHEMGPGLDDGLAEEGLSPSSQW